MSGSGMGDWFGGGMGKGQNWPGSGMLQQAMDELRNMFDQKPSGSRMQRGDVRAAVLALLAEQPMHGYQIISEIDERSGGSWKPSPGSVYPTLQLLADEGLVKVDESEGRKTYSLTDEGRQAADASGEKSAPWKSSGAKDSGRVSSLAKAGVDLAQAAAQVGRTGTPDQVKQAVDALAEARRKLYSILAQD